MEILVKKSHFIILKQLIMPMNNLFNRSLFFAKRDAGNYQTHRSEYYNLKSELKTINSLNSRISEAQNSMIYDKTEQSISPLGIEFGISSTELKRLFGKPRYRVRRGLERNHEILFYKLESVGNSFLVQIHFFHDKLVYVKSVFDYLKSNSKTRGDVINTINSKYNINIGNEKNVNTVIGDGNGNRMMIIDYGELGIQYFSGDLTVYSAIKNHCQRKRSLESQHSNDYVDLVLKFV